MASARQRPKSFRVAGRLALAAALVVAVACTAWQCQSILAREYHYRGFLPLPYALAGAMARAEAEGVHLPLCRIPLVAPEKDQVLLRRRASTEACVDIVLEDRGGCGFVLGSACYAFAANELILRYPILLEAIQSFMADPCRYPDSVENVTYFRTKIMGEEARLPEVEWRSRDHAACDYGSDRRRIYVLNILDGRGRLVKRIRADAIRGATT